MDMELHALEESGVLDRIRQSYRMLNAKKDPKECSNTGTGTVIAQPIGLANAAGPFCALLTGLLASALFGLFERIISWSKVAPQWTSDIVNFYRVLKKTHNFVSPRGGSVPHSSKIMSQLFFSIWSLNITVTKMHNTSF